MPKHMTRKKGLTRCRTDHFSSVFFSFSDLWPWSSNVMCHGEPVHRQISRSKGIYR